MNSEFLHNELYNLSVGVTPEDVDLATQQEILIVQAKRRKVKVPRNSEHDLKSTVLKNRSEGTRKRDEISCPQQKINVEGDIAHAICEYDTEFKNLKFRGQNQIVQKGAGDIRENKGQGSKKGKGGGGNRKNQRRKGRKDSVGKGQSGNNEDDLGSSGGGQWSGPPGDGGKDEDTNSDWNDGEDDDTASNMSDTTSTATTETDDQSSIASSYSRKNKKFKRGKRRKHRDKEGVSKSNAKDFSDLQSGPVPFDVQSVESDSTSSSLFQKGNKKRVNKKSKKKIIEKSSLPLESEQDYMSDISDTFSDSGSSSVDFYTSVSFSDEKKSVAEVEDPMSKTSSVNKYLSDVSAVSSVSKKLGRTRKRVKVKRKKDKDSKNKSVRSRAKLIAASRRSKRSKKGRKKTGRVAAPEEYFSDGEISSDSDFDKSDTPSEEDERDWEWLIGEDHDGRDFNHGERHSNHLLGTAAITKGTPGKEAKDQLMTCVMPLFTLMRWTGRLPCKMETKKGVRVEHFRFDRMAREFWVFCVTSTLLLMSCISMLYTVYKIVAADKPFTLYENALSKELHKYWLETLLTWASLFVTCTWSVMVILEGGLHLSEYLNRWISAVSILKYDVSYGLKWFLRSFLIAFSIYSVIFVLLFFFGGDFIPTPRDASGFLALLALHSFFTEIRFSTWYFLLQYVGLLFHLYTVMCSGFILIMIMTYSLALKNAAIRFNLRLALGLRKVALPEGDKMYMRVSRIIPYEKLWGEHVLVTTLSRHTGAVFSVPLNAYFLTKMITMIFTLYAVIEPRLYGFPQVNQTFLNLTNTARKFKGTPVRFVESEWVTTWKSVGFLLYCWASFFLLTEILHKAGENIMHGFGYVRRHGQVLSSSLNESRFIISLQNSAAPNRNFFINPCCAINREFVLSFLTHVMVLFMLLLQLSSSRIELETKVVCSQAGVCVSISYQKNLGDEIARFTLITTEAPETTTTSLITTTTGKPSPTGTPQPGRTSFPPCAPQPEGILPVHLPEFTVACLNSDSTTFTYIPSVFTTEGSFYDKIEPNCKTLEVNTTGKIVDCFGEQMSVPFKRDECKILQVSQTPDGKGKPVAPSLELVFFPGSRPTPQKIFCCYKYSQLESQGGRCNLPPGVSPSSVCEKSSFDNRALYENILLREIKVLDIKTPKEDSRLKLPIWTRCICQGVIGTKLDEQFCLPAINDFSPCQENFLKIDHTETQFEPGSCSWNVFKDLEKGIKMQILFQRDKYFQYYPIIPNGQECGLSEYDVTMNLNPFRNSTVVVTDCYGNKSPAATVADVLMDDCQNVKIEGVAELGKVEMKLVYKKANELPGFTTDSIFCCFTWENRNNASLICNLEASVAAKRCKKSKVSDRQSKESLFWEALNKNGGQLSEDVMEKWKNCICGGVGGHPKNSAACTGLTPHPSGCSDSYAQFRNTLVKSCADAFILGFFTNGGTSVSRKMDCRDKPFTLSDSQVQFPKSGTVQDCYGNSFDYNQYKDDCGNYRMQTPDANNDPVWPKLKAVRLQVSGKDYGYLCCWIYEEFEMEGMTRCNLRDQNWSPSWIKGMCAVRKGAGNCQSAKNNWESTNNVNQYYENKCVLNTISDSNNKVLCS